MILEETFTLSNGVNIPKLGLGTWLIEDAAVTQVIRDAVKIGYRHFDTAQAYANERGVGEGMRASGIFRNARLSDHCRRSTNSGFFSAMPNGPLVRNVISLIRISTMVPNASVTIAK